MSKNIKLNDTNYTGVSTVQLPTVEGGTATFKDTDEITTDEFVGVKYLDINDNGVPTKIDMRSLQSTYDSLTNDNKKKFCTSMGFMFKNSGKNIGQGMSNFVEDIYLIDGLVSLGTDMFTYCNSLKNIYGDLTTVTSIGSNCFQLCASLTEVPYMPNIDNIYTNAFVSCVGLTQFKFYKTPTGGIADGVFNNCTNLTNIYVPWAEGEVANAPWGATNATIHYNTTYDENHNPIV